VRGVPGNRHSYRDIVTNYNISKRGLIGPKIVVNVKHFLGQPHLLRLICFANDIANTLRQIADKFENALLLFSNI
jgi:hypothetical protein